MDALGLGQRAPGAMLRMLVGDGRLQKRGGFRGRIGLVDDFRLARVRFFGGFGVDNRHGGGCRIRKGLVDDLGLVGFRFPCGLFHWRRCGRGNFHSLILDRGFHKDVRNRCGGFILCDDGCHGRFRLRRGFLLGFSRPGPVVILLRVCLFLCGGLFFRGGLGLFRLGLLLLPLFLNHPVKSVGIFVNIHQRFDL